MKKRVQYVSYKMNHFLIVDGEIKGHRIEPFQWFSDQEKFAAVGVKAKVEDVNLDERLMNANLEVMRPTDREKLFKLKELVETRHPTTEQSMDLITYLPGYPSGT